MLMLNTKSQYTNTYKLWQPRSVIIKKKKKKLEMQEQKV